jgi:hypothetical protein
MDTREFLEESNSRTGITEYLNAILWELLRIREKLEINEETNKEGFKEGNKKPQAKKPQVARKNR